jgi:hypothetical protein
VALVVQQNSATAEEEAAASIEMGSQTDTLQKLISQFELKAGRMGGTDKRLPPRAQPARLHQAEDAAFSTSESADGFGKY